MGRYSRLFLDNEAEEERGSVTSSSSDEPSLEEPFTETDSNEDHDQSTDSDLDGFIVPDGEDDLRHQEICHEEAKLVVGGINVTPISIQEGSLDGQDPFGLGFWEKEYLPKQDSFTPEQSGDEEWPRDFSEENPQSSWEDRGRELFPGDEFTAGDSAADECAADECAADECAADECSADVYEEGLDVLRSNTIPQASFLYEEPSSPGGSLRDLFGEASGALDAESLLRCAARENYAVTLWDAFDGDCEVIPMEIWKQCSSQGDINDEEVHYVSGGRKRSSNFSADFLVVSRKVWDSTRVPIRVGAITKYLRVRTFSVKHVFIPMKGIHKLWRQQNPPAADQRRKEPTETRRSSHPADTGRPSQPLTTAQTVSSDSPFSLATHHPATNQSVTSHPATSNHPAALHQPATRSPEARAGPVSFGDGKRSSADSGTWRCRPSDGKPTAGKAPDLKAPDSKMPADVRCPGDKARSDPKPTKVAPTKGSTKRAYPGAGTPPVQSKSPLIIPSQSCVLLEAVPMSKDESIRRHAKRKRPSSNHRHSLQGKLSDVSTPLTSSTGSSRTSSPVKTASRSPAVAVRLASADSASELVRGAIREAPRPTELVRERAKMTEREEIRPDQRGTEAMLRPNELLRPSEPIRVSEPIRATESIRANEPPRSESIRAELANELIRAPNELTRAPNELMMTRPPADLRARESTGLRVLGRVPGRRAKRCKVTVSDVPVRKWVGRATTTFVLHTASVLPPGLKTKSASGNTHQEETRRSAIGASRRLCIPSRPLSLRGPLLVPGVPNRPPNEWVPSTT